MFLVQSCSVNGDRGTIERGNGIWGTMEREHGFIGTCESGEMQVIAKAEHFRPLPFPAAAVAWAGVAGTRRWQGTRGQAAGSPWHLGGPGRSSREQERDAGTTLPSAYHGEI